MGWGMERVFYGDRTLVREEEKVLAMKVLETVVGMAAQQCECAQCH